MVSVSTILDTIILGDCMSIMPELPAASVDMILCDLPYGTTKCKWDALIPWAPLWFEYKRIIKKHGAIVLCCTQPFTSALIMSNPKWFKYCWVWDKVKPNGHLVAKIRPMQRTEEIAVFGEGKIPYYPIMTKRTTSVKSKEYSRTAIMGGTQTDFEGALRSERYPHTLLVHSNANQGNKLHPTQKPVVLFEYLIRTYTLSKAVVLDNCIGSGTTAVAAINTDRHFIGIESEEKYAEIAARRVEAMLDA